MSNSENELVTANDGPTHDTIEATDGVVEMVRNGDKREMVIPLDSVDWDLTETPSEVTVAGESDEVTVGITRAQMQMTGELTPRMWSKQGYPKTSRGIRPWMDEYIERTGVDWDKYQMPHNHEMYRLRLDNHDPEETEQRALRR